MLQAFRDDAQGEGLGSGDRLFAALPVCQYARKLGNLGNPATIFLALNLNGKTHPDPPGNTAEVGTLLQHCAGSCGKQRRRRHEESHRPPS